MVHQERISRRNQCYKSRSEFKGRQIRGKSNLRASQGGHSSSINVTVVKRNALAGINWVINCIFIVLFFFSLRMHIYVLE